MHTSNRCEYDPYIGCEVVDYKGELNYLIFKCNKNLDCEVISRDMTMEVRLVDR